MVFEYKSGVWTDREMVDFDNGASVAEIDVCFRDWVKNKYKAGWEVVPDQEDAYSDCF